MRPRPCRSRTQPRPTTSNSQNDFDNSQVSKLGHPQGRACCRASMIITDSGDNFHRFCSNFLGTSRRRASRIGRCCSPTRRASTGSTRLGTALAGNGRGRRGRPRDRRRRGLRRRRRRVPDDLGHGPPQPREQRRGRRLRQPVAPLGRRHLRPAPPSPRSTPTSRTTPTRSGTTKATCGRSCPDAAFAEVNDYYDFPVGSPMSISGQFIEVPKEIATGKNPDGTDMMAADVRRASRRRTVSGAADRRDLAAPACAASADRHSASTARSGSSSIGATCNNVFQFIRIEDMACDKRAGMSNVVYLADSGRGARAAGPSGNAFTSTNGRIWKMVLDPPIRPRSTRCRSSSRATTPRSRRRRDPSAGQPRDDRQRAVRHRGPGQQPAVHVASQTTNASTTARLAVPVQRRVHRAILKSISPPMRVRPTWTALSQPGTGRLESSGIIDVSSVFGPGKFLVNVQAHTPVGREGRTVARTGRNKREGGQLLLITIPRGPTPPHLHPEAGPRARPPCFPAGIAPTRTIER